LEVLSEARANVTGIDIDNKASGRFDFVHICIPYSDTFRYSTLKYMEEYQKEDGLTIIHSTVPVGTSTYLGAVHSPIRGIHPHLASGIRTFKKFFGGPKAAEAAIMWDNLVGTGCVTSRLAEDTEAMKLWDTTYYGWNIIFEKAVKAYCDEHGLDFKTVYSWANETYNEGYAALGVNNVQRPVLKHYPGKIGGHCVIPNAKLLDSPVAEFLVKKNEEY